MFRTDELKVNCLVHIEESTNTSSKIKRSVFAEDKLHGSISGT